MCAFVCFMCSSVWLCVVCVMRRVVWLVFLLCTVVVCCLFDVLSGLRVSGFVCVCVSLCMLCLS